MQYVTFEFLSEEFSIMILGGGRPNKRGQPCLCATLSASA